MALSSAASRPHAGASSMVQRSAALRVKPFTAARRVSVRAAEDEAAESAPAAAAEPVVEESSFTFNYSEAKKGNSYEPSDVQAALDYYAGGAVDLPYEADFAVNRFGTEDASFFDDIDNNKAYAQSEYLSAGIEEAAPKTKQRGARDEDEAFDEAVEEFDQERAASAAFEGVEVLDEGLLDDADFADAPWTWGESGAAAATAAVTTAVDEEDEVLARLAAIDFEALKDEDVEQRELASMVVDALGDDLDLVALEDTEGDVAAAQELTAAEAAGVDEVLAVNASGDAPELSAAVVDALAELAAEGAPAESAPLPAGEVEAYLEALRAIDPAAAGGSAEGLGPDVRKELASLPDGDLPALPDLRVADLPAAVLAADAPLGGAAFPGAGEGAEDDAVLAAITAELAELEAIQVADYSNPLGSAAMFPEEADLEAYEGILDATAEYMAATGDEITGELYEGTGPDDAAINPFDDLDASLVASGPLVELEEDDADFQERILELTRVTKVVKGGKIMGFRAVVVVGDGAGRVGVGCQSGREVGTAVKRALVDGKKNLVKVPLVGAGTLPHRTEAWFKAAGVVVVPASEGTGVIAGGAVRSVLELAGVQNVLAKRLGSRSVLNNARVTIKALEQLRTLGEVARMRDLPLQALLQ